MPKIHADGRTTNAGQDDGLASLPLTEDAPAPAVNAVAGLIFASGEAEVIRGELKSPKRGK